MANSFIPIHLSELHFQLPYFHFFFSFLLLLLRLLNVIPSDAVR